MLQRNWPFPALCIMSKCTVVSVAWGVRRPHIRLENSVVRYLVSIDVHASTVSLLLEYALREQLGVSPGRPVQYKILDLVSKGMLQVSSQQRVKPDSETTLHKAHIVVMKITKDLIYCFDFLLPTRTWEYAGEDVSPCRRHQPRVMHPAIFSELGIAAGGLPVDDPCNRGAFDENVLGEKVTVR